MPWPDRAEQRRGGGGVRPYCGRADCGVADVGFPTGTLVNSTPWEGGEGGGWWRGWWKGGGEGGGGVVERVVEGGGEEVERVVERELERVVESVP